MNKAISTFRSNRKLILQIAFGLLSVFLGVYFYKHERTEISQVKNVLIQANSLLVFLGIGFAILFVFIQGFMYQYSFKALNQKIPLLTAILLFLKRNFISVFIPGGTVTNMFFFNKELEQKHNLNKTLILYASTLFTICSVASSVLVVIPALLLLFLKGGLKFDFLIGIGFGLILVIVIIIAITSFFRKGVVYKFLDRKVPSFIMITSNLQNYTINKGHLFKVLLFSVVIEIMGIVHLYISMIALNIQPSVMVAIIGYALVLIILLTSPFLKGIGAIELALTYALTLFGLSAVQALSVAFLFRFFEFWSIFVLGFLALIFRKDNILFRVFPAILLFALGFINIVSAITPALPERFKLLKQFIPMSAIDASIWLTLFSGFFMLIVASFLIKGLKNAWKIALILTLISFVSHITKGIDWEEASLAFVTMCSLLYTRKQYFIKSDVVFANQSWFPAFVAFVSVLVFGIIGFYFLDKLHFNINFTLWESFEESVSGFFLLNLDLTPLTPFAKAFLFGLHTLGILTMGFWVFLFLKPYIFNDDLIVENDVALAKQLTTSYGRGSLDYFKLYNDKLFWFNTEKTAFISYKISGNYAIVLENPVAENKSVLKQSIRDFDVFCKLNGLRKAYYRVLDNDIDMYKTLNKKALKIGAEAVLNLEYFTLEGGDKKPLRNAFNKVSKTGFIFKIYQQPQKEVFLQQLKAVSNEWLIDMEREEILFSQGAFNEQELKEQTIYTMESTEGKIYAFVNLIPNYKTGEANFDLMRKSKDAPNGAMDFLFVNMFQELKQKGYKTCNLGMVPLSGIDEPKNFQERAMKTAYEHIKQFSQYKNLYHFKEKYNPDWIATYLVYDDVLDLIYIPNVLRNIMEV